MPSVITENLNVSFGGKEVLRKVSLTFPDKGLSVLASPSGSGKTTFLRSLNRLNEELGAETSGQVLLDFGSGPEAIYGSAARPVSEIRRLTGMVFQSPNVLPATIWKNMSLPLSLVKGLARSEVEGRIEKALRAVGLWDEVASRLHSQAATLSGGQQQRLCLARALALEPQILLLDEPTASLDVLAAATVEECLKELAESYPLIVASHSLSQAWRLTDRLHFFHHGRFLKTIAKDEIKTERDLLDFLAGLEEDDIGGSRPKPA